MTCVCLFSPFLTVIDCLAADASAISMFTSELIRRVGIIKWNYGLIEHNLMETTKNEMQWEKYTN